MSWEVVLLAFLSCLLILMFTGIPVAFAFLTTSILASTLLFGFQTGVDRMVTSIPSFIGNYSLLPIPMFMLMGELLFQAKVATRTLDAVASVVGRIPGRLGVITMAGGTALGTLSGSAVATTSMLSRTLIPEMLHRGYSKSMSAGPILAAGGLAMIVPPSAMAVLVGTIGNISIGRLLIAGILPGLLLATLSITYIVVRCWRDPSQAPNYATPRISARERLLIVVRDILPLGLVVLVILGLIVRGIATPTEAAAFGVLAAAVLMVAYRTASLDAVVRSFIGTVRLSGMILLIMGGAAAYSQLLAFSGATRQLLALVTDLPVHPLVVIGAMILLVVLMGSPMEQVSILLITLPIFVPVVVALGYDAVWFGIIMLITMDMANLTPPLGLGLFAVKGAAPSSFSFGDVCRAAIPFIGVDFVAIALLMAFPAIVLFLPDLLLGAP